MVSLKRAAFALALISFMSACSQRNLEAESASPDAVPFSVEQTNSPVPAEITGETSPAANEPSAPEYTPGEETAGDGYAATAEYATTGAPEPAAPAPKTVKHKSSKKAKRVSSKSKKGKHVAARKKSAKKIAAYKKSARNLAAHKEKRKQVAQEAVATAQIDNSSGGPTPPDITPPAVTVETAPTLPMPDPQVTPQDTLVTASQGGKDTEFWVVWGAVAAAIAGIGYVYRMIRAKQARNLVYR